jgi:hypothetical protein
MVHNTKMLQIENDTKIKESTMKNKNTQTKKLNSKKQKPAKVKLFSRQPKIKKPKIARKDRFTKRNFMRLLSESMVSKN